MSDRSASPTPKENGGDDARSRSRSHSPRRSRSHSPGAGGEGEGSQNGGSRDREATNNGENGDGNPGNNVYVANLPLRMTQAELEEAFSKFGRLERCEVIVDPATRESRGFAFVTFEDTRDAQDAVQEMNGKDLQGRRVRVEIAKRRRGHEKTPGKYLGPRQASTKYGRDGRDSRDRGRDRSRDRGRDRSRSRDRRRYDDRDRYDRRHDDRGRRRSYDRYDDRRSRR